MMNVIKRGIYIFQKQGLFVVIKKGIVFFWAKIIGLVGRLLFQSNSKKYWILE